MDDAGYLLDNRQVEAGRRFDAFTHLFDPVTFRHLEAVGIALGWRCWEVGAGGPSVPTWIAGRVGSTGSVLATDIDLSQLPRDPPFSVLRHDISTDDPPGTDFDLVHARLVLVHVRERAHALDTLVAAVRPGGWLVIEDADPALQSLACPDEQGPAEVLANRVRRGVRTLLAGRGAELAFGRTLPRLLRERGLEGVEAEAFFPIASPACTQLELATVSQVRDRLVAARLVTDADIDRHLVNVAGGSMDLATAPLVSAWGRRPG